MMKVTFAGIAALSVETVRYHAQNTDEYIIIIIIIIIKKLY